VSSRLGTNFGNVSAVGAGCLLAAVSSLGCTSPNTYATARTVAPGKFVHTVAAEGIGYHSVDGTGGFPILPTYALRVGVVDRIDVGARLGSLTEIGIDAKFNILRGRVDVAVAAGAESFLEWNYDSKETRRTGAAAYIHVPVIVSYNVTQKLSLVGVPGLTYVVGKPLSNDFARTQVFGGGTPALRLGAGIDYRWQPRRAFHPEVTVIQSMLGPGTIVLLGFGFNIGSLPDYGDIVEKPAEGEDEP
jgi:hypothetical protein